MSAGDSFDVVVVGSGAGGGPIALELARAGMSVLVLEKGADVPIEKMTHDEIAKRRHFMVPSVADEPHTLRMGERGPAAPTSEGWIANIVGGGTVHFSGFFHRLHPIDMKMRSTLGPVEGSDVADWPIRYEDLEPFYARVDKELGVSGVWKAHPHEEPRSAPYPLPPISEHPIAKHIDEAAAKLGLHAFPTPRALLSQPYDGRGACSYCPMCAHYGCPTQSKGSSSIALLPKAVATGKCEIRPHSMAVEVAVGTDRVKGVVYRDAAGNHQLVKARVVVLACSAIETARLLLSSISSAFPNGLANRNGRVGKGLWFSTTMLGSATFDPGKIESPYGVHLSAQRSIQDFYYMDPAIDGVAKAGTLNFLIPFVEPIAIAEGLALRHRADDDRGVLWGSALKRKIEQRVKQLHLQFESFAEYYTNDGTYVDLDPQVKDRWGAPVARMTITPHPKNKQASALLAKRAFDLVNSLGPDEAFVTESHGQTKFLQGGTCRFGTDPASTVLDKTCRAHDVPNLYVTDGAFMPTSGGVPPTLTIMANSFRVASAVVQRFKEGSV